ncbi:MAG: DUF3108 domain-containing protein [Bacteroidaceae bacterium]|nr:DUF3108 domain-containing protein [Bacteroidaceae bacterium]
MRRYILSAILCLAAVCAAFAQCPLQNTAFSAGESLKYQLFFNWKFIWIKAGTAELDISSSRYNGQEAFRCHLITRGSKRTDKYFFMRDTLLGYVTPTLEPLYYRKGAFEGKRYTVDEVWYNYAGGKTHLKQRFQNRFGEKRDTANVEPDCVFDMVSMLLRARSFDPKDYKEGQRIHFRMADGDNITNEVLVYRGRKKFTTEDTHITYQCLVFSFVEIEGKKEKEVLTFYISDDANHIPVRLDLFLKFGTAKAFLTTASGLRNPQTSIIDK